MSLLDTGPDTIVCFPAVRGTDRDGNPRWVSPSPDITGVVVSGVAVQPSTSDVATVEGQQNTDTVRVIGRALPVDADALTFGHVEWDGRRWWLTGRPLSRTRIPHVSFSMSTRGRR